MGIEFPLTISAFLTIAGAALFASLVGQWLKAFLPDWRFTNLLVLALAILFAEIAQCIVAEWRPGGAQVFEAGMLGFFAASLATFGFELIANLLGKMGWGKRSDVALAAQAEIVCRTNVIKPPRG